MHRSIPTVPPPSEIRIVEKKLANAPWPGQTSCSNAPGAVAKNVLLSSFLVLLSIKSKLTVPKNSPS